MSKPEVLTGRKDGKTRRNAVKHNKEYATVIAFSVTPKADSYRPDEESAKSALAEEESAQSAINSCGAAHGDSGWWCVAVQHRVRPATNINNTCAKTAEKKVIQLVWFT